MGSNPTLSAILASILVAALCACGVPARPLELHGPTMGTTYTVKLPRPPRGLDARSVETTITGLLDEVDATLSTYDPRSEISSFNASGSTVWIPASPPLSTVVKAAIEVGAKSNGAFDISVAPLVDAWGFGSQGAGMNASRKPDPTRLAQLRRHVGPGMVAQRDAPAALRKADPEVRLDLDGIAPGYAVDELARRMRTLGIADALIEIGGEVTAIGSGPSGHAWRVAIEAPLSGERRPYAIVELDGFSISTSGDYRDFRIVDGRRISHTIDPRSGAPVMHLLASVSVIHRSAMYADAYATALTVLGPVEGPALATRLKLAALFLVRDPGSADLREIATPEFATFRRPLQ